jgi:hypothetical protein
MALRTLPSQTSPRRSRWVAIPVIWTFFYSLDVLLNASLLRVHLTERCWTMLPPPSYGPYITQVSSVLAATTLMSLLAIIVPYLRRSGCLESQIKTRLPMMMATAAKFDDA